MVYPVLAVSFIMNVVMVLSVITALLLILIILIQKGRGGGLSGAFGGGAASGIMGSKTGDFLTWVTVITVAVFLTLMVIMAKWYKPIISQRQATLPPVTAPAEQPATSEEGAYGGTTVTPDEMPTGTETEAPVEIPMEAPAETPAEIPAETDSAEQ